MLKERAKLKNNLKNYLFKNENIRELILDSTGGMSVKEMQAAFKEHVKSHLFIDDTLEEVKTFIFFDVILPNISANTFESEIILYAICHRNILENYSKEGYSGDRIDILAQMIEETLLNDKDVSNCFGIGEIKLDNVSIYNTNDYYGCILDFNVYGFRG